MPLTGKAVCAGFCHNGVALSCTISQNNPRFDWFHDYQHRNIPLECKP